MNKYRRRTQLGAPRRIIANSLICKIQCLDMQIQGPTQLHTQSEILSLFIRSLVGWLAEERTNMKILRREQHQTNRRAATIPARGCWRSRASEASVTLAAARRGQVWPNVANARHSNQRAVAVGRATSRHDDVKELATSWYVLLVGADSLGRRFTRAASRGRKWARASEQTSIVVASL